MQDVLANRLLNHAGAEALNRQTVQALQKDSRTGAAASSERLRAVAREFESLFLNYMLSVMRETIDDSGLAERGAGEAIYTELFDQEVARCLAGRGALGISDLLIQKLSSQVAPAESESGARAAPGSSAVRGPGSEMGELEDVPDFRLPLQAHVSSGYGSRVDPITHEIRMHRGVDIAAPAGMAVRAACAGVVVSSGYEKGYGNTVVVRHPGGFETRYAHLSSLKVKTGDEVQASGIVGTVGSTGHSTGPHLHFELIRNGNPIDPEVLLSH